MTLKTGFYPGSFDPPTNGHMDVMYQAVRIVDRLIVAIGVHHGKPPLFDATARAEMVRKAISEDSRLCAHDINVTTFDSLAVEAMQALKAAILIRGLRDTTDHNYEMQLAGMNATLAPDIQTLFVPASPGVRHVASSLVRQIALMGGDAQPFVPACVVLPLKGKFT